MHKFLLTIALILFTMTLEVQADCLIMGEGKLTDIKIEDNSIIDVCPLVTIMNDKNTLVVHPLKDGNTRFCVLKDGKNIVMFNVKVNDGNVKIDDIDGFEVLSVDEPPFENDESSEYELIEPPSQVIN
jgi:hypothetical protein